MKAIKEAVLIEKKSKFYSYLFSIQTQHDVMEIIQDLQKEHKKATHICYAFRITNPFSEKAVDDGEPSGTAGRPILTVLQRKDLHDVLLVVVRYFGGIKLGAGGLIRAYSKVASMLLD